MSACVDYRRHEIDCPHRDAPGRVRWRTIDGCQGTLCGACLIGPGGPHDPADPWADLTETTPINRDGIPRNAARMTYADTIGDMLRRLRDAGAA